jgi:hypothetical protein
MRRRAQEHRHPLIAVTAQNMDSASVKSYIYASSCS